MSFFTRHRNAIDAASKIGGICLLIFYVAQYSVDIIRTNQRDARAASISYIQRFADSEILEARLALLAFWNERADLAQLAVRGAIPGESFGYALLAEMTREPETLAGLKRIGYFFDELYHCHSSGICNAAVVEEFFCPHVIGNEETYFRFLRQSEAQIIGRNLYTGVKELSDKCLTNASTP